MHDWLGIGLIALGLGLIAAAVRKHQSKKRPVPSVGTIRPEFAAMGDIVRPIILFGVAIFALKMTLFYFIFSGQRFLSPLDFAGILFLLAAYSGWLIVATRRPAKAPVHDPVPSGERSPA